MTNKVDYKKLNKLAVDSFQNLENNKVFSEIQQAEDEFYQLQSVGHKNFYGKWQSKLVKINGQIQDTYGTLSCMLESYIAIRKTEMLLDRRNIEVNGKMVSLSREPGDALLTDFAKSEVKDLLRTVRKLEDWRNRIISLTLTCRSMIGEKGVGNGK